MTSPAPLVSVAQMQAIERAADAAGTSFAAMMERAGAGVAAEILARNAHLLASNPDAEQQTDAKLEDLRQAQRLCVLVLAGPGNNGGDGLVAARHLVEAGAQVRVYLWRRRTTTSEDYQGHFAKLVALRVESARADDDPDLGKLYAWLEESDVVVDALLGTGSNRPIMGDLADVLDCVRALRSMQPQQRVFAVDCPSGVHCDSGAVDPHTVPADVTLALGFAKLGHYKFPAAAVCGEIVTLPIGIADTAGVAVRTFLLDAALIDKWMPERSANSHKGSFGKAFIAAGSVNYPGAAVLSASAAARTGAGLVTCAVPEPVWGVAAGQILEATWHALPALAGSFDANGAMQVHGALEGYTAFLLGCGLTQNSHTLRFCQQLLAAGNALRSLPPTVIDADGLNCLALTSNWPALLPPNSVLTPHAREFSRLLQVELEEVIALRWELALEAAISWNTVVLAKGPYTVIASPEGELAVLPVATPALATAGTGDVLAGAIVGLMAQGLTPFRAACVGAWLHGRAGLLCAAEFGDAGALARDVLLRLPAAMRELRENAAE